MAIFAASPPQNVNRGLAEPWQSPLPYQIELLKMGANLGTEAAKLKQKKELENRKLANELWDEFEPDMEGLTNPQREYVGNIFQEYFDKYAGYINAGVMPQNKTEVLQDQFNLEKTIKDFNTQNKEVVSFKEYIRTPAGSHIPEDKIVPLVFDYVMRDEEGNLRTDMRPGEIFRFANNDPRAISVWDGGDLWRKYKRQYSDAAKDWIETKSFNFGDYESNQVVHQRYTGPGIWDEQELSRGRRVLKEDVVQSIPEMMPDLHKKVMYEISQDPTTTDANQEEKYRQKVYEYALRDASGKVTIESFKEAKDSTDDITADERRDEQKVELLDNAYNAQIRGDASTFKTIMNQMSEPLGGTNFVYVEDKEFDLINQTDEEGNPKKIKITGYIPKISKAVQDQLDLNQTLVAVDYDYEEAVKTQGKILKEGFVFLPEYAIGIPSQDETPAIRRREAINNTIKMARLQNLFKPGRERFRAELLDQWRTSVPGENLFEGEKEEW